VDPAVENWLRLADTELDAARSLLRDGHNLHVVITCQQAAEKALKALVAHATKTHPPRSHDLQSLLKRAGVTVPDSCRDLMEYLDQAFMTARYPLDLDKARAAFTAEVVAPLVATTAEFVGWARSHLT
jgi:HEPN domain-containing protein